MTKQKNNNKKKQQEVSAMGKALRALGAAGGSTLGASIGAPVSGGVVGNSLGAAISKWLGFGDYTVSKNSIVQKAASGIPMMHKEGQSVTIRHREYLGQISGSTGFSVQEELPLNPGMSRTFPWLSNIAHSFQEYKFKGLVFHYIPTSGTAISSTNSALGSVLMQTSYRANDVQPASKVEMLNEYWANEVVPFDTMAHPIECDPKENPFEVHYVRGGDIPSGDILLYDIGKTFVAVAGQQGTNVIGDLWVTYEVELKKPVVSSNVTSLRARLSGEYTLGTYSATDFFNGNLNLLGTLSATLSGRTITLSKGIIGFGFISVSLLSNPAARFTGNCIFDGPPAYTNCTASYIDYVGGNQYLGIAETACTDTTNLTMKAGFAIADPSLSAQILMPAATIGGGTIRAVSFYITVVRS
jgi:hypothetical protein